MAKCTLSGTSEHTGVCRAVERSKEILNHVNQAVREAEDRHRLAEIHKRLDRTAFDKADHQVSGEFKVLLHFDKLFLTFIYLLIVKYQLNLMFCLFLIVI